MTDTHCESSLINSRDLWLDNRVTNRVDMCHLVKTIAAQIISLSLCPELEGHLSDSSATSIIDLLQGA